MPFKTPLQETVAEVNFAAPALLEFRAATLYNALREQFPNYIKFPFFLVPAEAATGIASAPYTPAYRFTSSDGKKMLQYGPRMISFNTWAYEGWAVFREEFAHVFRTAADLGFGLALERIALTYVNRMPVQTPQELQQLLCFDLGINDQTAPLDFMIRKVDNHEHGLSTTIIQPLLPDEMYSTTAMGITCTEVGFVQDEFNYPNMERHFGWFEEAHARAKERFWNMLRPDVQTEWRETYAARAV